MFLFSELKSYKIKTQLNRDFDQKTHRTGSVLKLDSGGVIELRVYSIRWLLRSKLELKSSLIL